MNGLEQAVVRAFQEFERLEWGERVGFNTTQIGQKRYLQSFQLFESGERLVVERRDGVPVDIQILEAGGVVQRRWNSDQLIVAQFQSFQSLQVHEHIVWQANQLRFSQIQELWWTMRTNWSNKYLLKSLTPLLPPPSLSPFRFPQILDFRSIYSINAEKFKF